MSPPEGPTRRFLIVVSRFNEQVTERLLAGARACLEAGGVAEGDVAIIRVPGAWELPIAARIALANGGFDAAVAIGCIIRGETPHFDHIAHATASGLARVALDTGVPIAFGVLTTDDADQALARAGGRMGNKGWEAAESALELAALRHRLSADGAGA